jgi:BlaI family penicillinase repressor
MKKTPKISDAEWEVMKVIWDHPFASAAEIADKLSAKKKWNPRTVRTLLSRLVKKRALVYEAEGNRYLYKPKIKKEDVIVQESQSFVNRVFDGVAIPMLVHFVKNAQMTPEEIQALKQILAEKERGGGNAHDSRESDPRR